MKIEKLHNELGWELPKPSSHYDVNSFKYTSHLNLSLIKKWKGYWEQPTTRNHLTKNVEKRVFFKKMWKNYLTSFNQKTILHQIEMFSVKKNLLAMENKRLKVERCQEVAA